MSKVRLQDVGSIYSAGKIFDIVECGICSVYYNTPPVSALQLEDFYRSNYGYTSHHLVHNEKLSRARKLKRLSGLNWINAKVGEVGSGAGEFAEAIASEVQSLDGCELDETSSKNINFHNVTIHTQTAETFLTQQSQSSFDIFVLSHSLEHMLDPKRILNLVHTSLKNDGSLLIVVPNRLAAPRIFQKYWGYWQVPIHICHFDLKSLSSLLESEKFLVHQVRYRRSDFMALGSFIANLLGIKSNQAVPNNNTVNTLVRILSRIYSITYRFGKHDLIVVARKKP